MGKYRGLNITGGLNANFRKIKVRKTLDTMELLDRGSIAEAKSDLPTKGAAHRRGRGALKSQRKGANSATRGSISMGWIAGDDSNVIGEHDYGYVFRNAESSNSAVWNTRRALGVAASIADEQNAVATAPVYATGVSLYNSTGIIPAGTPLILNEDGTVSAVAGSAGGSGPYTYTADTNSQEWEVDADYQNQSYPDRWGESWNKIATNGTYTVIGDSLYEELDNGNKTYSGGHAWIIRNSDGAVMKSWNSVVDGDSPNDATLVSFGGTTTGGVTYANSKYNQAAFGNAVAINNNYAFVSAGYIGTNQFGTDPNFGRGELYVISLEDFSLVTVIDKPAAYPDSGSWNAAGSTSWAQQQIILDDNTMVISAPNEDSPDGTTNTSEQEGSIYVYDISGDPANWSTPIIKLTNPIPDNTTDRPTTSIWWNFGNSIAVDFTAQKMVVEWGQINNGHHSAVYDFSSGWSNTPINRRTVAFQAYPGGSFTSLQGDTYYYYTTDTLTLHAVDISQAASGIYTPIWSKQFFGGSYAGGDYINVVLYDESYAYISNVAYDDPTYSDQGQVLVADLSNNGNVIDTIDARQGNMTSERFGYSISLGTGGSLIVAGEKSASVGPNNENLSRMYLYQVGPGAGSTNLTDSNFIGFAKDGFPGASLGKVVSGGGVVGGFTGLIAGNDYYVQPDGSISQVSAAPAVLAGTALSDTTLQVAAMSPSYSYSSTSAVSGTTTTSLTNNYSAAAAITLDGNTVAIGYDATNTTNENNGKVVIHTKQNGVWTQTQVINCPTNTSNWNLYTARFGATIKFTDDGTRMLVDAPGYGTWENNYGGFFIYDKNETTGLYEETQRIFNQQDFYISSERGSRMHDNRIDITSDGTLIAVQQAGVTGHYNSESKKSYILIYRKTEDGTYSYVGNKLISDQSYYNGTNARNIALSDNGHIILGHEDSGTAASGSQGGAEHCYFDINTETFTSQYLTPSLSGVTPVSGYNLYVQDYGLDVAISSDGMFAGVIDRSLYHQAKEDGSSQSSAVFIFKLDTATNTFSQVQILEHADGLGQQTQSLQFNRTGSQLYTTSGTKLTVYNWDNETNAYVKDSTTDGWSAYQNRFWMSRDGAHILITSGTTFNTYGGTT